MASHGRRNASYKTKLSKAYKKQRKTANLKLKKLNKSRFKYHNPAMENILNDDGTSGQGTYLPSAKGMSVNRLRQNLSKASKFNQAETSTPHGAKKVLRQTLGNIFKGSGGASADDIKMYNNFDVLIESPDTGVNFVQTYFDVFYSIKDKLTSKHIANVPSDEILDAIKEEVYSANIIKDTSTKLHERDLSNGDVQVIADTYIDVMNSAEFIDDVVARFS